METAGEAKLAVGPEDVTELLQSHGKTSTNEESILINGQKKNAGILEIEFSTVKMLWKLLK